MVDKRVAEYVPTLRDPWWQKELAAYLDEEHSGTDLDTLRAKLGANITEGVLGANPHNPAHELQIHKGRLENVLNAVFRYGFEQGQAYTQEVALEQEAKSA